MINQQSTREEKKYWLKRLLVREDLRPSLGISHHRSEGNTCNIEEETLIGRNNVFYCKIPSSSSSSAYKRSIKPPL